MVNGGVTGKGLGNDWRKHWVLHELDLKYQCWRQQMQVAQAALVLQKQSL